MNNPKKFKAQLVAKRYAQINGVDFNEVFSPMVKHKFIRILLALLDMFDCSFDSLMYGPHFLIGI